MGARFIGCDRDQVFLMPPSLRDWVPEGHLVWTVLDAVGELDLSAIYADYRDDGRGRPAYEPSMMVALLLYAYARGNRSSRGIERACVEDVAYRVVTGNLAPDHSTIAEFRCRHERALGEVFSGVLGLCARAGLVSVGVVAIDGTKMAANASSDANRDFGQIAREILAEAAEIDRARGRALRRPSAATSCPSSCAPARAGARRCARPRNAWRANATRRSTTPPDDEQPVTVELDPARVRDSPAGSSGVGARGAPRAGRRARARGAPDRQGPRPIGCLRRAGAWRKSSTSSTPRTPPMTPGAREASPRTARGGWRRGWSSRTSRCSCRAG